MRLSPATRTFAAVDRDLASEMRDVAERLERLARLLEERDRVGEALAVRRVLGELVRLAGEEPLPDASE